MHVTKCRFPLCSRQLGNPPLQLGDLPQLDFQVLLLILELHPAIRIELGEDVVALTVKLQDVRVVLPQTPAVADGHEGDAEGLGVVVHDFLGVEGDAAGALVEDGVAGAVVEEASHGDALLETAGKNVPPLGFGIPTLVV